MRKNIILGLVVLWYSVGCVAQSNTHTAPQSVIGSDGNTYAGEMGWVSVVENRDDISSAAIEIPFFRLKTKSPDPLPPIFVLEGGPGDNPSVMQRLEELVAVLSSFSVRSDVVIFDQRGNGNTKPNLRCPNTYNLPLDRPLNKKNFVAVYRRYIEDCSGYLKEKHDLSGYNVVSMADDIEAIRKALRYEKIMLFGGSFGSHHALTYIKKYPNRVDRVSLDSPEGLQHTVKLPYEVDKTLIQLSELVREDSVLSKEIPSFELLVKETLATLEKKPIKTKGVFPGTSRETEVVLGKYDLQLATAMALGRRQYRALPYHFLQMKLGDYSWLANWSIGLRNNGDVGSLMPVLTDCTSGIASKRKQQIAQQAKDAILGDALNNVIFEVCDLLPLKDIQNDLATNFSAKVPLLLLCGSQDARTPLRNAMEISDNFENARILEVRYGSHDLFREAFEALFPILRGYLSADDPITYEVPSLIFAPLNLRVE